MDLPRKKRLLRTFIKRFMYSQLYFMESFKILFGRSKPVIRFTVEQDPPSTYYNFRLREDRIQDLAAMLDLPKGFNLTKMRCLTDDPHDYYCLTLNVYRVSGLTNGLRAEWSTYVTDLQGQTRYMVVEARSNRGSMDPIDIITKKSKLEYTAVDDHIHLYIASYGTTSFKVEGRLPSDRSTASATKEWIQANDDIYWLNGVMDRTYYNCKMVCSDLIVIPAEAMVIEDTTKWQEYIEGVASIVMFPGAVELLVSPWWNL